ncbi:hypothetical protein F5Y15DRAFT_211564 [Xylariaceae sp. FL0016]|nr:hypothetical protein F5Y15DRAFT_211564 [Xylariaceae sp. FL0016]
MPNPRAHLRSSRRIQPLKDDDIDHEISLVDRDDSATPDDRRPLSAAETIRTADISASGQPLLPAESQAPLTGNPQEDSAEQPDHEARTAGPFAELDTAEMRTNGASNPDHKGKEALHNAASVAATEVTREHRPQPKKEPETEIDILYENERGGFLCGIPLFSSAALGNLDPPAWTNFAHKPSPTNTTNAQVPDPSWEWAWPEWRINRDECIETDSDGWEYSFMFSKKFSWHGPKWYNSYVRRRTWIRRRIKKGFGYQANDEHLMNTEYFTVASKKEQKRMTIATVASVDQVERDSLDGRSRKSIEGARPSRESSRRRTCEIHLEDDYDAPIYDELKTTDALMPILRRSRIDREKLEAMDNYIEHSTDDLQQLQDYMHEIMSIFMFQASRKLLLARLIQLHDKVVDKSEKGKSLEAGTKAKNLAEAIKHADEEVRRLEYWSDIKDMAESGESKGAVDRDKGWDAGWEGLDKSGAKGVNEGERP